MKKWKVTASTIIKVEDDTSASEIEFLACEIIYNGMQVRNEKVLVEIEEYKPEAANGHLKKG